MMLSVRKNLTQRPLSTTGRDRKEKTTLSIGDDVVPMTDLEVGHWHSNKLKLVLQ
jgi:hypothetical protein